jgi:hypothetical protein
MLQKTINDLNNACIGGKEAQLGSFLQSLQSTMKGDMLFVLTPATLTTPHSSLGAIRYVQVSLQDSNGNIAVWYDGNVTVSIAKVSTAGTVTIPVTTLPLVQGQASVAITESATAWLAGDTTTLTVTAQTIDSIVCATKTSVETMN